MKPSETAQVNFIADCLRKGEQRKIILGKFGKKWVNVSRTTFDRRLREAEKAVAGEQATIKAKAEQEVAKEVEARKTAIMTAIERQELLTKIANGEISVKKPVVISGQVKLVPHEPDLTDRINAMKELNKMTGAYSPTAIDIKTTVKQLIIEPASKKDKC